MFTAFGYGRASTSLQVLSTDQQHAKIKDAVLAKQASHPDWADAVWGGFMADEATCRESCFRERHAGSLLLAACRPGDFIVVSNFDRLFASVVDACETLEYVNQHRLRLWILDFGGMEIDTSTPMGETFIVIMAQIKRLELLDIRRRVREAMAHRKRIGRPYNRSPIGFKTVAGKVPGSYAIQKFLVPDHQAQALARECLRVKTKSGRSYRQACFYANSEGLRRPNGKRWAPHTFMAWCRAAESGFVLPNGSHDPAPIPLDAEPIVISTITPDV